MIVSLTTGDTITSTPPFEVDSLDTYIVIAVAIGGGIAFILMCLAAVGMICGICFCTRSHKTTQPSYERLPRAYAV